jgi:predicted amidohydrolase YtcJ
MRTLYRAGAVFSPGGPAAPVAAPTALLVDDGTVAWLGSDADAVALTAQVDAVVDLGDTLITPAFVDAHVHTTETGLLLGGLDLHRARSVTEILALVETAARRGGGRPILGQGWDETLLAEHRPPTRAELDRASAGGVVYLARVDVHSAVVSSALAAACEANTVDGWDDTGRVERDAHHACRAATRGALTASARRAAQLAALTAAAAAGIATVHEMSAPHIAGDDDLRDLLQLAADPDRALPEVVAYRGELVADVSEARAVLDRLGVPLAGLAGDLCVDGSVGSRTAAYREAYTDAPGKHGHLYLSVEQVRDHVAACTRLGLQAGFHVIGDAAVEVALRGVRRAAEQVGIAAVRAAGHRLEHVESIDHAGITDLADLGVRASMQPAFDALWGGPAGMYAERLGPQRALAMNPIGALAAAGVSVALGSDSPVTRFDPWGAVRGCVHHHAEAQRIGTDQAFRAHTVGGHRLARAAGGPGTGPGSYADPNAGTIAVGTPATFAVWAVGSGDLKGGLPDLGAGAPTPNCLLTVGRGRILHDAR